MKRPDEEHQKRFNKKSVLGLRHRSGCVGADPSPPTPTRIEAYLSSM